MPGYSSFIVANVPLNARYTILAPSFALNNNKMEMFPTDKDPRCPYRNRKFDDYNGHSSHFTPILDIKPLPILNLNNNFDDDDGGYEDEFKFKPNIDVKPLHILNPNNNFQDDEDEDDCDRPYYLGLCDRRVYY